MSAEIPSGAMRFNSDSQKLEYWNGSAWFQVHTDTPNLAQSGEVTPGARGLLGGGEPKTAEIMFWSISSLSNGADFGDLTVARAYTGGVSSRTRAVWGGGFTPASKNEIDFVTIASTGNATDFGDLQSTRLHMAAAGNQTRGIFAGGENGPSDVDIIDYITIAATGNSIDFGDLPSAREAPAGASSSTRMIIAGGFTPSETSNIEFVTIATLGNSQTFGDLSRSTGGASGGSNATRGLFAGGSPPGGGNPGPNSIIDSVFLASLGNGTYFGDLSVSRRYAACATSSTRATWCGGLNPSTEDRMDYVEIATEGNAVDFGDLNNVNAGTTGSGTSNAHGGL